MNAESHYTEFMQDIYARSGADSNFNEDVFTERMCDFLVDQAIIENFGCISYKKSTRGIRADAWENNIETKTLTLFITDYRHSASLETLTQTQVTKSFKRAEKFFTESLKASFYKSLEESTPGYELAREIHDRSPNISKVRFILLSNAQLSSRIKSIKDRKAKDFLYSFDIWDVSRVFRLESSGRERENIEIDFSNLNGGGISCLPAFTGSHTCETYLLAMPGDMIADLYDKYGERLLEQNVRTFLQFRGKVNKGIRNSILNEPGMFFSYNNGLSATAEQVETLKNRERIKSVTNLQIVNGGQTTASIFTAMKSGKADLQNVYVQVKLTIIPPEEVEDVVPRISEYANTQNKVNAADFFSNHPFHLRIEEFSRRLWAASPEGDLREAHWFYERARGQFVNAQANLSKAKKKEFLAKNPRNRMFKKTDLAKFEHSFAMLPHVVSLGAQKNFAQFASDVSKEWEKDEKKFNELYFKRLISKALLFRFLDKNIMKQPWYGGFKANIVTYSIAKLIMMVAAKVKRLDLDRIWKEQKLTPALEEQLLNIAEKVNERIQHTPEGITNITEWCKKEKCWNGVQSIDISLSLDLICELIEYEEIFEREKDAEEIQKQDNEINSMTYVFEKGDAFWKTLRSWNEDAKILSPKEIGVLNVACKIPKMIPSDKQSQILIAIEERAVEEGYPAK